MAHPHRTHRCIKFCNDPKLLDKFRESAKLLDMVQKGLSDYLETKRAGFSRFYFLSNDELLEILSQTKVGNACFGSHVLHEMGLNVSRVLDSEGSFSQSTFIDISIAQLFALSVRRTHCECSRTSGSASRVSRPSISPMI